MRRVFPEGGTLGIVCGIPAELELEEIGAEGPADGQEMPWIEI